MDAKTEKPNFDHIMVQVSEWSKRENPYPFRHTITHNLLLMGKTRTGKSTVVRVLEDPCHVPQESKLHSETKEVEIHSITSMLIRDDKVYAFNVIDTPGFYDQIKKEGVKLTNDDIKAQIQKCMKQNVTNIHLFAYVLNLKGSVDSEDIASMVFVKTHFPWVQKYVCLLVTHCEEASPEQRKQKVNEFFQTKSVADKDLQTFFGDKVLYMGSLRPELKVNPNMQGFREQGKNVHDMRIAFLDYIIGIDTNECFNIHKLTMPETCRLL
jgi:GTP-binding protein EngB required for normal cell division